MPQVVGSRQAGLSQHNPDNNEHGNPQTIELIAAEVAEHPPGERRQGATDHEECLVRGGQSPKWIEPGPPCR